MHVMSVCLGSVQTGFVYTADMAAGHFDVVLDPCCVLIIFQLCFYTFKLLPVLTEVYVGQCRDVLNVFGL